MVSSRRRWVKYRIRYEKHNAFYWLDMIEHGITRLAALHNLGLSTDSNPLLNHARYYSLHTALAHSFSWDDSKEGLEFWYWVAFHYTNERIRFYEDVPPM